MRVAVLRNPKSGRGAGSRRWADVETQLRNVLGDRLNEIVETEGQGTAGAQARGLVERGFDVIAVSGGDGTVNEAAQGIIGSAASLAILPLGTGNDFARTLGVGPSIDLAIDALAKGSTRLVDVVRWQAGTRSGYFLNLAGFGFDAAVADRINRGVRWLRGQPAYLVAIVQTLVNYKATTLRIVADGQELEERAMLCALANAQSYGGGIKVAPTARLDDGLIDMVLVGDLGKWDFLTSFPKVYKGSHLQHPKVKHFRAAKIEVESDPPGPFLVDGELVATAKATMAVEPLALRVVCPAV